MVRCSASEPGRATLGGIIAANVSGPRRLSIGAARDHLLGCTAVSGRGETLKAGGAVVKNVTGFDLPKLLAGSWGTLAVLLSITLRVLPRPRSETTLLFGDLSDAAANRLMGAAMATTAAVSAAAHVRSPRPLTALRLEGFGPSVDARCRELLRALEPLCAGEAIGGDESSGLLAERAHARRPYRARATCCGASRCRPRTAGRFSPCSPRARRSTCTTGRALWCGLRYPKRRRTRKAPKFGRSPALWAATPG